MVPPNDHRWSAGPHVYGFLWNHSLHYREPTSNLKQSSLSIGSHLPNLDFLGAKNLVFRGVFHQFCFQTKTLLIGQTGSYLGEVLPRPHPWKLRIWNFKTWRVSELKFVFYILYTPLKIPKNDLVNDIFSEFYLSLSFIFAWQFHPNSKYFHPYPIKKKNLLVCMGAAPWCPMAPLFPPGSLASRHSRLRLGR